MTNNIKIAVVGGRDFADYKYLDESICTCLTNANPFKSITIVSGGAKGADSLGERFANAYGFKKMIFKPDWEKFGKGAGFKRNRLIIENADVVFAFWDGKSKGTKNSIDIATELEKELYIYYYNKEGRGTEV